MRLQCAEAICRRVLRYVPAILSIILIIASGCSKKFLIPRGQAVAESEWKYSRKDAQASAKINSQFGGQLNIKWEDKISETPVGPLTVGAGRLIFCGSKGRVHFFDLETGRYAGRHKNRGHVESGFIIDDSLAYYALGSLSSRLICLDLHNQRQVWNLDLKEVTAPPIIIDNRLYISADTGMAGCVDRMTGKFIWRQWVGSKSLAGPSYDDGVVYYPSDKGVLSGLNGMTGDIIFQVNFDEPLMSKAAVGDKIYLSGVGGGFFALDKKTGKALWAKEFPWPIWTSPAIDENLVYVGDNGGYLRALDNSDGRTIWEFRSSGVIVSSPIIVGDFILFASLDKNIYCLDKKSGLLVSKRELKHEVRLPLVSDGRRIYLAEQDGAIQCFGD